MVSVIIPTLNSENSIFNLISCINLQSIKVDEIVVIDSMSDDGTVHIAKNQPNVRLMKVSRKDFDHGRTRDFALKNCKGDYVVFMTQDALPYDNFCIENLVNTLKSNDRIAVVCGRQLPKEEATKMERFVRYFNYPAKSNLRSKSDIDKMGIKTFFSSDVCAAYNRKIYEKLGGFEYPIKTSEDLLFAAKAINNDYLVAYNADAKVFHSHNLTLRQQYKRNFITGYEIQKHINIFQGVSLESEGVELVKYVSRNLLKTGNLVGIIYFGFDCCARFLGNKMGRIAAKRVN